MNVPQIKVDCSQDPLIICIRYSGNIIISQDVVRYIILKIEDIAGKRPFGILANFENVIYVEEEAREMFGYKVDNLIAVAVVFEPTKQQALKNIFLEDVHPEYMLEFFPNEDLAIEWLKQILST